MAILKYKRSAVPSKVPSIADLNLGELAINTYDGKVYVKKDNGTQSIVQVGAGAGSGVQTITSTDGSIAISGTSTDVNLSVSVAAATNTILLPVRNNTGALLAKGTVVYINGALGQNPTVTKAIATSDATSAQTLGLITANINNNSVGNVTLIGSLTNLDTSAFTDGQQLYLSPTTAGAMTATKPLAPYHLVYIAIVEHAHPTLGKLFVKVQNGYEMDELHDVSAVSPANNDGLFYNTATSLWEKKSVTTALGSQTQRTFLAAPNGANGVATFRTILASDIPTLNQDTTGTAGNITGTYGGTLTSSQVTTALGFSPTRRGGFVSSPDRSVAAVDLRNLANPTADIGYVGGGRFRFATLNDNATTPYADVIDLSTYTDASGGGFNSLYFSKSTQVILHKFAIAGATTWSAKTIAYTDSNITGNAANVTGTVAVANGGTGGTTAAAARTNLGATTVGSNLFTLTNPAAITFPRFNADNTVSALDAATFRTAIGAGTSSTTGTVTSVAALTLGTTGTDLSSTVANGSTTPVITLNVPTASGTVRGVLSSTDWTTFNSKQAALVSGTNIKTVGGVTLLGSSDVGTIGLAYGGTGATGAAGARTNLGATTIGSNIFTLINPSAITFPRFNADNTVSALDAATFRTAIGAGTSSTTGTVTSVAALTLGTTGTDISSSVANGSTTPVITLNVPTASASVRGALSSTDWSTFNGKQAALTSGTNIKTVGNVSLLGSGDVGTIGVAYGGTGTTTLSSGYLLKGNGTTAVSASVIYDNGTNVGIGTSVPAGRMTIEGAAAAAGVLNALTLRNSSDGGVGLYFDNSVSSNLASIEALVTSSGAGTDDGILSFSTAANGTNSERMRIGSNGSVSIGTTNTDARATIQAPSGNYLLDLINGGEPSFMIRTYNHGTGVVDGSAPSFTQGLFYGTTENAAIKYYRGGSTTGGFMAFTSNDGSERMRINASGQVGIGTTSQTYQLQVRGLGQDTAAITDAGNKGGSLYIQATANAAGSGGTLLFGTTFGNATPFAAIKGLVTDGGTNTVGDLAFSTRNSISDTALTERMRIAVNGYVGIGTSAPSVKLNVVGGYTDLAGLRIAGTAMDSVNNIYLASGDLSLSTGSGAITFKPSLTEYMRINASGQVGIGTTAPTVKLQVISDGPPAASGNMTTGMMVASAIGSFALNTGANSTGGYTWLNSAYTNNSGIASPMVFMTGAAERMRLDASGNLGIGTTAPVAPLQVVTAGTTTQGGMFSSSTGHWMRLLANAPIGAYNNITAAGTNAIIFSSGTIDNGTFTIAPWATTGTKGTVFHASGGVSIGTTSDPSTGALYATGNITAYFSDERLKTRLGDIEDALGMIDKIDAFYYEANETAKELGYDVVREVGVSAQSVQRVLPEVVAPAPIDDKYLTVRYERLVPVLIQAIKELKAEIDQLKGK